MGVTLPDWAPVDGVYIIELPRGEAGIPTARIICGAKSDALGDVNRLLAGTREMVCLDPGESPSWVLVWLKSKTRPNKRHFVASFGATLDEIQLSYVKAMLVEQADG